MIELNSNSLWKVFLNDTAFPCWMAMDIRWKRKEVWRGSFCNSRSCQFLLFVRSTAKLLHVNVVSTASETKRCVVVSFKYLTDLLAAALFAASPTNVDLLRVWDSAKMVTSHAVGFYLAHGNNVAPSERLPSVRIRPTGSFAANMLAQNWSVNQVDNMLMPLLPSHVLSTRDTVQTC